MRAYVLVLIFLVFITACSNKNIITAPENNQIYGELYNWTESDNTLSIGSAGVYYNMTALQCGLNRGFTCSGGFLTAIVGGTYKITWQASLHGGNNNEYDLGALKNYNSLEKKCLSKRDTSSVLIGSVSGTCLIDIAPGDYINFVVEDEANPPADVDFHAIQLNIVKIV